MKNLNQNNSSTGQSTPEVRKSQKHDANLQKNSTLYFQVGLILCLLGTFALFEMQFEDKIITFDTGDSKPEEIEIAMVEVKVYEPEVKQEPKKEQTTILKEKYRLDEDNTPDELLENIVTPEENITSDKPVVDIEDVKVEPIIEDVPIINVQFVPIFPGCERYKTNAKRRKCLNEKLGKLVQRKFNTDIASDYGLSGVQKIDVQFKVDKTGHITDIKTRAPHPKLEDEAKRIINKIPKMKPGKMGDRPVNVIYTLPIKFKAEN